MAGDLDINDAAWDPQDKLAYLTYLQTEGVPAMRENRGKLLDLHGNDRSDLIPQVTDGDITPLLPETMQLTAAYLQVLIEQTRRQMCDEHILIQAEALREMHRLP